MSEDEDEDLEELATEKQLAYIARLGGTAAPGLTKEAASTLISEMVEMRELREAEIEHLHDWADDYRGFHNCKRIPKSATESVFKIIGPRNGRDLNAWMKEYFGVLIRLHPEIFKNP